MNIHSKEMYPFQMFNFFMKLFRKDKVKTPRTIQLFQVRAEYLKSIVIIINNYLRDFPVITF